MAQDTGGWIWYELMTTDPDGAKAFYEAVVGWTLMPGTQPPLNYGHILRSDGGSNGGVLPLTKEMCDGGAQPGWVGYIHVPDIDAAVAAIVADGGKLLMPKMTIDVGSFAMVTDPQGAPFYVMTPVPPAGEPDATSDVFSPDEAQHVRWNELRTTDPDGALAFYRKHFGWGQDGAMDMGEMGQYRFIQQGGMTIGAVMAKMPEMPASCWGHYIGVDDIDRAMAAVVAGGGKAPLGPMEIPGGEFAFDGFDPQGAAFGVVGPRKG